MDSRGSKDDVSLPRATLMKAVRELIPKDVRVSKGVHDKLMDSCLEFINLVSTEANEVCVKEDRKTIAPEHIITSLESLGFGAYIPEVMAAWEAHKLETLESPRSNTKWSKASTTSLSEAEAIAEQQKMFAEARMKMNSDPALMTRANEGATPGT